MGRASENAIQMRIVTEQAVPGMLHSLQEGDAPARP
jgi:hypothetical protein